MLSANGVQQFDVEHFCIFCESKCLAVNRSQQLRPVGVEQNIKDIIIWMNNDWPFVNGVNVE